MKFEHNHPRESDIKRVTEKRIKNQERKIAKHNEQFALFSELQDTRTGAERLADVNVVQQAHLQKSRDLEACLWRKGRALLFNYNAEERKVILRYWSNCSMPKRAIYFYRFLSQWGIEYPHKIIKEGNHIFVIKGKAALC